VDLLVLLPVVDHLNPQVDLLVLLPVVDPLRNQIYLQLQNYLPAEHHQQDLQKVLLEESHQKLQPSLRDQHPLVRLLVVALLQQHLLPPHKLEGD
jgi:hypothetical protein